MIDQNTFMETLRDVAEIVRTNPQSMTKEEILSYFQGMDLSEQQKEMVFSYLTTPQEEPVPEQEEPESAEKEQKSPAPSKVFSMYMEEINALPQYTAEELQTLYASLAAGEQSVIEKLLKSRLKEVLLTAKRYWKEQVNLEDIVQEGNMAVFLKLSELCGSNASLESMEAALDAAAAEAVRRYISDMTGEEDCEETIAGKVNLVAEAKKFLTEQNKTEPSVLELSAYTHMDQEELMDILDLMEKAQKKK